MATNSPRSNRTHVSARSDRSSVSDRTDRSSVSNKKPGITGMSSLVEKNLLAKKFQSAKSKVAKPVTKNIQPTISTKESITGMSSLVEKNLLAKKFQSAKSKVAKPVTKNIQPTISTEESKIKEQTKKAEAKFERLLEGCLDDLPNLPHSTVRIFMSSTFSDMRAERNAIVKEVHPFLEEYCAKYDLDFQIVDMRWGVTEDSQNDHSVEKICLLEVENCQNLSLGPNFITAVVPWCQIAKNPAFLAILVARFCVNWVLYALVTSIPTFMKTVLRYDIQSNGAVSSLPFACQVLTGFLISQLVDLLRKKSLISTTVIRRLCSCLGFVGSGVFLIGTGFTSCEDRETAVVLLSLAFLFNGFHNAGCLVNNIDIGQKYAGTLLGLTNTLAIVPGMVAPIVTSILTPNDTAEEWRHMFYVCAGVCMLGIVVYGCFASGEVQEWAKDETEIYFDKTDNVDKNENTKL